MPLYDFYCDNCEILREDEYFKLSEKKDIICFECGKHMRQVLLSAPGLSDPGGIGNKWTNDGYQEAGGPEQNLKIITKKYEKGKRVI